jgi:sulfatase maturation enzyme AslB (radical SAM superfamily)
MNLPKKFCAAPFKTAVIDRDGAMLPCCEFMPDVPRDSRTKIKDVNRWWTIELEDLRNDMREGRTNSGCQHCLDKEKNPFYFSHRQYVNQQYFSYDATSIDSIEIRVSNYCNLKCIMCGPYASSSIADEYKKHEDKYNSIGMVGAWEPTTRWWDDQESLSNLKDILSTVSNISFTGGEPLLVPEVIDIIDSLDPNKIRKIEITTNLTRLTDKFLESIKKFKKVNISVSLEGISVHNDYIRYGSDWNTLETNMERLSVLPNINLAVSHVLQHTSIFALPNLIRFVESTNKLLHLNEVYHGSYPSPGVLTVDSADPRDINKFVDWLDSYNGTYKKQLSNWIKHYEFNKQSHEKFIEYTAMLDSVRGNSFLETFNPTWSPHELIPTI